MMIKQTLLDALSGQAGCTYLSDLHSLNDWQRLRLARGLERIPADAAGLQEWNDALEYLSGDPPQETAQAAREQMIHALSQSG